MRSYSSLTCLRRVRIPWRDLVISWFLHGSSVAQTSSRIRQPIGWAPKVLPTKGLGIISDGGAALASMLAVHVALWSLWISLLHPSRAARCTAPVPWPSCRDDPVPRATSRRATRSDPSSMTSQSIRLMRRRRCSVAQRDPLHDPAWCAFGRTKQRG